MKGFTLIELMIAVAIIGIVTVVAIPSYSRSRIKMRNAAAKADVHNSISTMLANFD